MSITTKCRILALALLPGLLFTGEIFYTLIWG